MSTECCVDPAWQVHCDGCKFHGQFVLDGRVHDVYTCMNQDLEEPADILLSSVIVRYGPRKDHYWTVALDSLLARDTIALNPGASFALAVILTK